MVLLEKRPHYETIDLDIFVPYLFSTFLIPTSAAVSQISAPSIQLGFLPLAIQLYLIIPGSATSPARHLPDVLFLNKYLHLSSYKAESNESILDRFFFFPPLQEDKLRIAQALQQKTKDSCIWAGSL